jgi:cyclopropane-fatty-acyl-phospholipid synthase
MPVLFKHFPSLLAPYEWVLSETDHVAAGAKELMKI